MDRVEGPSAARVDLTGRMLSIAGILVGLVAAVAIVVARPGTLVTVACIVVVLALLVAGQVVRARAAGVARREAVLGYSTLHDVAGYEFRDGRTGEVIRSAAETPLGNPSARVYDGFRRPPVAREERPPVARDERPVSPPDAGTAPPAAGA